VTSVRFHPDARAEAREAATWYRARSVAAARGFALILDEAIRTICEHPAAWPPWPGRDDVRRRVLRRYPFTIVYLMVDDAVVIVAVAHQKRRPGYWLPRL